MTDDILTIVKMLLSVENESQDDILMLRIDMTIQSVLNYCNVSKLPKELVYVVAKMVVAAHIGATGSEVNAPVKRISEGDRSVSFDMSLMKADIDDSVKRMTELDRFKQVYRM